MVNLVADIMAVAGGLMADTMEAEDGLKDTVAYHPTTQPGNGLDGSHHTLGQHLHPQIKQHPLRPESWALNLLIAQRHPNNNRTNLLSMPTSPQTKSWPTATR